MRCSDKCDCHCLLCVAHAGAWASPAPRLLALHTPFPGTAGVPVMSHALCVHPRFHLSCSFEPAGGREIQALPRDRGAVQQGSGLCWLPSLSVPAPPSINWPRSLPPGPWPCQSLAQSGVPIMHVLLRVVLMVECLLSASACPWPVVPCTGARRRAYRLKQMAQEQEGR